MKKSSSVTQFLKFGLVGVSNTLINYIVYVILCSLGVQYLIANTFGFIISVLNAYFWGSRFVFKEDETKEKRIWWKVLLKTYASYFLGYVLNQVLLIVWIDTLNIGAYFGFAGDILSWMSGFLPFLPAEYTVRSLSEIIAPILNIFITVPINFVINKFWAYRQKSKNEESSGAEKNDREIFSENAKEKP